MAKRFRISATLAVRLAAGGLIVALGCMPARASGQTQDPPAQERVLPFGPGEAILLRSTLIAINQANLTGDYSVLHAIIEPERGRVLSREALAEILKPWREPSRDFGFAAIADAELRHPPSLDSEGRLNLVGTVPTPSFTLAFDLGFVRSDGRWKLVRFVLGDGTLSTTSELPPSSSAPAPAAATQTAATGAPSPGVRRTPPLPPTRPGP